MENLEYVLLSNQYNTINPSLHAAPIYHFLIVIQFKLIRGIRNRQSEFYSLTQRYARESRVSTHRGVLFAFPQSNIERLDICVKTHATANSSFYPLHVHRSYPIYGHVYGVRLSYINAISVPQKLRCQFWPLFTRVLVL